MGWSESDFMNFICWNMLVLETMQKGKYWTIWYASIIALVIWLIRLLSHVYTISSIVQYSRGETSCWPWKTQYFHWYAMKLHVHQYVWWTHVIYVTITCFLGTQKSARAKVPNKSQESPILTKYKFDSISILLYSWWNSVNLDRYIKTVWWQKSDKNLSLIWYIIQLWVHIDHTLCQEMLDIPKLRY